ncbi:MAG TPA: TIGR03088 family PEP-CTERM/XrtA system glycosyltransferase [Casimicrobiaceae bacterium]|jgi:sugar transferase (PEP-CTERM/EpsH1 system associated)
MQPTPVMQDAPPLVLHVIHHLAMGGLENGLINLIDALPSSEFRHAVVCIEDYSDFRQRMKHQHVEVVALHRSRVGIWRVRRQIYQLCQRLRPAVLHTRNLSGLDALFPARLAGVAQCVHGEHGWDVGDLTGDHWKPALLRRLHSPLIDRYVTVSKDLERYLVNRVGVSAARISQIYNGVDTERFVPAAKKPTGVLPGGFADDGRIVIGTVGRIQSVKDQATLVRAFAELINTQPHLRERVRLAIVGDGPLLADLRALISALALESLAWLPGATADVPRILQTFDMFVLPSLAEGVSNTILEAMATGLPILASAVGGNVEIVEDGATGRLFQPGDVEALTRFMAAYLGNPQLRDTHGRASRRAAVERFGLDAMVAQYRAVYTALVDSHRECLA